MSGERPDIDSADDIAIQFDKNYFAALSPAVLAVTKLADADKPAVALKLALQGVPIDLPIIVWGTGPWLVHAMRTNYGIPYELSMEGVGPRNALDPPKLMNVPLPWPAPPPGALPTVYFDPKDEAGTLARLAALYPPPPPPPVVVVPPVEGHRIGTSVGAGYFMAGPGTTRENTKDGETYAEGGKNYTAHVSGATEMDAQAHNFQVWYTLVR